MTQKYMHKEKIVEIDLGKVKMPENYVDAVKEMIADGTLDETLHYYMNWLLIRAVSGDLAPYVLRDVLRPKRADRLIEKYALRELENEEINQMMEVA